MNNTDPNGGAISNWLITLALGLTNLTTLTFFARSTGVADGFPDRLEVRLNKTNNTANVGANATSLGNFTDLLLTVNPVLGAWTQYTVNVGAVSCSVAGRLAFRYNIPDVTTAGDYLGIDDVVVNNGVAVPEPSTISLFGGGLLALYRLARSAKSKHEINEVNS